MAKTLNFCSKKFVSVVDSMSSSRRVSKLESINEVPKVQKFRHISPSTLGTLSRSKVNNQHLWECKAQTQVPLSLNEVSNIQPLYGIIISHNLC